MQCATFVLDPKMEISTKRNPQNGRKKSAKRTQKTSNKRNLRKCSKFLVISHDLDSCLTNLLLHAQV